MKLLIDGSCSSQAIAHKMAEQEYNYYIASKEFYEKLVSLQKKSNTMARDIYAFLK